MQFDEDLEVYTFETDGIMFGWEEEPEGDYETVAKEVAEKYRLHLPQIIEFILPDLIDVYGDIESSEVEAKLGMPLIYIEEGVVTYLEQEFDDIHMFSFEYLDDEFHELQYFCIDG